MVAPGPRLLLIGFDGLDYELLKKRNSSDIRLLPLLAPIPATGPSWTSMYTGDSMATHNIRDVFGLEFRRRYSRNDFLHIMLWHWHNLGRVLRRLPPRQRHATYETTSSKYLWDTLSQAGVKMKMVNMPITSPVRPINGVYVGGFPVILRKKWYYPDTLEKVVPPDYFEITDMIQWFSDPEMHSHRFWKKSSLNLGVDEVMRRLEKGVFKLVDFFLSLPSADLEMIQFSFIDRLGHVFEMTEDIEQRGYELVAKVMDRIISEVNPQSTIIVSDHGFQITGHTELGCLGLRGELAEKVICPPDYTPCVLDVAPTLASFLGAKHDCEGNDLTVAGEYVTRGSAEEQAEKEKMMQNLKDLGYL